MMKGAPRTALLVGSLLFGVAAGAEDAASSTTQEKPSFAVLKVVQAADKDAPEEGAKVSFQVVASKDVPAEKKRILRESKDAHGKWKEERAVFLKDKANGGKDYYVPEPGIAKVVLAKDRFPTEEKAQAYAKDQQEKADKVRDEFRKRKIRQSGGSSGGGGGGGAYVPPPASPPPAAVPPRPPRPPPAPLTPRTPNPKYPCN